MPDLRGDVFAHSEVGVNRHADSAGVGAVHHVVQHRRGLLELRVGAHHVIAFHEGLHRGLPVGGKLGRIPPLGALAGLAVRLQSVEHRADGLAETGRSVVEVDEHAAQRLLGAARAQREIGLVELALAEHVAAIDEGVLAFAVPAPAVERADEPLRLAVAVPRSELDPAMAAGVVERLHPVLCAHHQHRFAEVGIFDPVADLGDLLEAAGHLPDVRPQVLDLGLVERRIVIAL